MDEPFDQNLARLFDQAHEPLPGADFSLGVERSIRHARRRGRFWRVVLFIDLVVAALILSPYALDGSVAIADSLSTAIAHLGGALISPYGIGGSLAFSAWFLRRLRRLAA